MNVFDPSAVEALAFSYLSHGFLVAINNLWTWIAVVTAALSFWRIRAVSGPSVVRDSDLPSRPCLAETVAETAQPLPSISTPSPVTLEETKTSSDCFNCVTKRRKFSIKFEDEGEEGEGDRVRQTDLRAGKVDGEWWGSWERLLRTKQGDMSWYRYQDLTAINGNVVRLWDDFAGARDGHSSSCAVR